MPMPALRRGHLEELASDLRAMRARTVARLDTHTATVRENGDAGGDEADLASREHERATSLTIVDREIKLLAVIDEALSRIAAGAYGICEGTGDPIGYARLKAGPWVRYSLSHKEELERAEKSFVR